MGTKFLYCQRVNCSVVYLKLIEALHVYSIMLSSSQTSLSPTIPFQCLFAYKVSMVKYHPNTILVLNFKKF